MVTFCNSNRNRIVSDVDRQITGVPGTGTTIIFLLSATMYKPMTEEATDVNHFRSFRMAV
jgi:hypothetical protein